MLVSRKRVEMRAGLLVREFMDTVQDSRGWYNGLVGNTRFPSCVGVYVKNSGTLVGRRIMVSVSLLDYTESKGARGVDGTENKNREKK